MKKVALTLVFGLVFVSLMAFGLSMTSAKSGPVLKGAVVSATTHDFLTSAAFGSSGVVADQSLLATISLGTGTVHKNSLNYMDSIVMARPDYARWCVLTRQRGLDVNMGGIYIVARAAPTGRLMALARTCDASFGFRPSSSG